MPRFAPRRWVLVNQGVEVVVLAVLGIAAMAVLDAYSLKLLAKVFALWVPVLGLQLLILHTGVVSLGHAAFVALGAYVAGMLSLSGAHNLWALLGALILVGAAAGLVVGVAVLRVQGLYQLMATLAVGQMMYYGFQSLRSLGGDDGFALPVRSTLTFVGPLESDRVFGFVVVGVACACAWLVGRLRRSELGAQMQAARDDGMRLASLGVSPYKVRLAAFVVSAVLAAVGGAFMAHLSRFASPQLGHWTLSGELMVLMLLGGSKTRVGPFAACVGLVLIQEWLSQYTDHWPLVLGLVVLGRVLWPSKQEGRA